MSKCHIYYLLSGTVGAVCVFLMVQEQLGLLNYFIATNYYNYINISI